MTCLLERTFPRSVETLLDQILAKGDRTVEIWLFDDLEARSALAETLKAKGIKARVRSSYKPLLHFFLEEVDTGALADVNVTYPVHEKAAANRFLLEAYPLAQLLQPAKVSFQPADDETSLTYSVRLIWQDGRSETHKVFAPNHLHQDFIGEENLSPTGWIRWQDGTEERVETDYEQLFNAAMEAITSHDWGKDEPYFEELNISVHHPASDLWLPMAPADGLVSLREALHEDFYFSLLEVFQQKSGKPIGDRGLMPGQIVPEIFKGTNDGPLQVKVEIRPLTSEETEREDTEPLEHLQSPLTAARLRQLLGGIEGTEFETVSRAGRPVPARYHKGTDRPVMISGGQHANEVTGPAGAIRTGLALAERADSHFTIAPLENPDGYQLGHRLRQDNPCHMLHAARYTAFGCDLEYSTMPDSFEAAIRRQAESLSGAQLHINLHGYPAHEWARPFTGYIPRGFEKWTLPKGFFLIVRHHEGWKDQAKTLVEKVTERLAHNRALVSFNAQQIALFTTHADRPEWPVVNGFPVMIVPNETSSVPVTLITEYPDESIYGDDFIQGHTAQLQTALAAYEIWQTLTFPADN